MADFYRCSVKGLLFGQACDNELYYLPTASIGGPIDPQHMAIDFRAAWRKLVLPRLSPQYSVLFYETQRISGVIVQDPAIQPVRGLWRYDNYVRNAGTDSDIGQSSNADSFPSMVCVSFGKSTRGWYQNDAVTAVPLRKKPRGSIGFGGIPRAHSQATSGGNVLTAFEQGSWIAVGSNLADMQQNSRRYFMMVVTMHGQKGPNEDVPPLLFDNADPPAPTWQVAQVTEMSPSPFLSTRNTRKQTISSRG